MSSDKIDSTEVGGFWDKLFYLIKLITGDVKVSTKGTLQSQIDEMSTKVDDCFTSVSDGKKAVASAITDKGVTTAQNAEFATMAANVRKIKTNPTLQAKAITLDTSKTTQTLTPDPGYDGLSQVKASITTQTKSVNLSTSQQVVKPDSGKVLSQVTVPAVTGSAGLKDVVTGKTFNSATAGIGKTGTLPDKRGTTVDAAAVNQDDTYTYFTVPTEAVYDAKSKLRTLSSNLANNIVSGYSDTPIGNGKSTATVSIKIPSDNCVIILAHPEDTRATTTLELPTGATLLLSDITSATGVYYRCRYYVVKVTGRAGATLDFNFTSTGTNNYLYIRYVTINSNVSTAMAKTSFEKNNLYVIVRNVDYRAIYHDFYGAIYQYYDMPYTTTYFVIYQMANITVLKALEDSERNLKTSGNYSDVIIKLE